MYWRPWTQITYLSPLGGFGSVVDADSTSPSASGCGALMMLGSFTTGTPVSTPKISPAATVQPISSRVLPWIWAATGFFLARNLYTEYASAPSTITNTTAAMYRMILYS